MMETVALLAAREWSSRLPHKASLELAGVPVLRHIIDRLEACDRIDKVVLCTSTKTDDDAVADIAADADVPYYRSDASERADVVALLSEALVRYGKHADYVYRAMGDCPLFSVDKLAWMIDNLERTSADLCWVGMPDDPWPIYGSRESPWSFKAWQACAKHSEGPQLEHAGSWIYANLRRFRVLHLSPLRREFYLPFRVELDTPDDYAMLREVFDALYDGPGTPSMIEALRWLRRHPDTAALNQDVPTLTITKPEWRQRGTKWVCPSCGCPIMRTTAIVSGRLRTVCPRCGCRRDFVEVPAFLAEEEQ